MSSNDPIIISRDLFVKINSAPIRTGRRSSKKIETFVAGGKGKKFSGKILGDTFRKDIRGSEHMLQQPLAIAIAVSVLEKIKKHHVSWIEVYDQESDLLYYTEFVHFMRHSFEVQRGGYEPQRALTLDRWTIQSFEPAHPSGQQVPPECQTSAPIQLGLF